MPARMARSGTEPEDVAVEGRAIGYDRPPGSREIVPAMEHIDYRPFAAAGAYTTVEDLARFFAALRSHKLLNAKYTGLMLTPVVEGEPGTLYGYGMKVRGRSAEHWIGHDGVDHGMNAEAWFSPEKERVIVILANLDVPAAAQALDFLEPRLSR